MMEVSGRIRGPRGSGDLNFEAIERGSSWAITRGFVVADGTAIDIVQCTAAGH